MQVDNRILKFLGHRPTGDLGPYTIYTSKRGAIVAFPRSPPDKPPTPTQTRQRNRFRAAAAAWRTLPPERKILWQTAARLAHLRISGYDLWVYWSLTFDTLTLATVERHSRTKLLS